MVVTLLSPVKTLAKNLVARLMTDLSDECLGICVRNEAPMRQLRRSLTFGAFVNRGLCLCLALPL